MRVQIETDENKIVIDDSFNDNDKTNSHKHNAELVELAYTYLCKKEGVAK